MKLDVLRVELHGIELRLRALENERCERCKLKDVKIGEHFREYNDSEECFKHVYVRLPDIPTGPVRENGEVVCTGYVNTIQLDSMKLLHTRPDVEVVRVESLVERVIWVRDRE